MKFNALQHHTPYLALVCLLLPSVADASNTLYKCTDDSGVVLYTNQKVSNKRCIVLSVQVPPARPAAPRNNAVPPAPSSTATPTPSGFPRVSGTEQKARDNDRKAILERELATEQANLDKARQALAAARPDGQRPLQDSIALHERNIEALNKELTRLR